MTQISNASEETKFNGKIGQLKESKPLIQELIPGLKRKSDKEYCGPCPHCKDGEDRFIVFTETQTYWCRQCEAKGDILSYITLTTGKSIREQLAEAGLLDVPKEKTGRGSKEKFIWSKSKSGDSPAHTYLSATRGIANLQHSPAIRWNSFTPKDGKPPINRIVLRLSKPGDNPDDPASLHYLFLDTAANPPKKTGIQTSNAEEGAMKGRAVWFYPDKDTKTVAVAEGAETTLSVLSVLNLNGAAALTTSGLKGIVLPQDIKELFIFCDQDTAEKGCAGQKAALELAKRFEQGGGTAWIVSPSDQCFAEKPEKLDFNDLLKHDPSGESIKARFEKKQRLDEIDWRPKEKEQPEKAAETEDERWFLVEEGEKGKLKLTAPSRAAQVVSKMIAGKFAVDADTKHWHQYTGEQWKECKGEFKENLVSILEKGTGAVGCNASYKRDIEEFIVDSGRNKIAAKPENKVPFINGIFDLKKKELVETTPDNALQWCLPYKYDKTADCKFFKGWLDHVCDDDTGGLQKMIRAVINVCMMERPDLQYFVHLVGKPGSGKGTLSRLLQKIVGSEGFTTSDIELLQKDKFESSSYYQKRMVIFDEVPGHVPIKKFLQLTGRDPMRYEQKYEKIAPTFIFGGLVLLLGNSLFSTDDQTNFAPERRRLTVRFDKVFTADEKAVWNAKGGEEEILHKEIPGIINWALEMSKDEVSEVFHNPPVKVVQANQEAEAVSSPIVEFVKDHIEYDPTGFVYIGVSREQFVEGVSYFQDEGTKLYPRYLCWCKGTGRRPLQRGKFLEALIEAANRRLLPLPDSEPVEKGATKLEGGYPVKRIRLVPWTETEFGS
jgi:putative DNA primase/helicase